MHPEKYTSQPVLTAKAILESTHPEHKRMQPPETVLIFMSKAMYTHAITIISAFQSKRVPGNVLISRRTKGIGILGDIGVGGPSVVAHLEILAAWGVKQVILAGKAGGLLPSIHYEDIVIPSKAFRDDGVSDHYLPPADWATPSLKLNQRICEALTTIQRQGNRPTPYPAIHEAPVWTTASIFRETKAEVREYAKQGMAAVEMEAASLFTAAEVLGLEAAAVLVISDSLATGSHQLAPRQRRINQVQRQVTRTLIHLFKL